MSLFERFEVVIWWIVYYQLTHFVGGRDSIGSDTRQILDVCTTLNRAKRIHLMPQGCDTNRNSVPTAAVVAVLTNLVEIPYVPAKVLTECLFTVLRRCPDVILAAVCLQLDGGWRCIPAQTGSRSQLEPNRGCI